MALALTGSPQITAAALDAAVNAELAANWFPLAGDTTGGNAAAGKVGEYISASLPAASAIVLASTTFAVIVSINLTAGDWDVAGLFDLATFGATTTTVAIATITTGAGNTAQPLRPNAGGYNTHFPNPATGPIGLDMPVGMRINVAAATVVNLLGYLQMGGAVSASGSGFLGARRAR